MYARRGVRPFSRVLRTLFARPSHSYIGYFSLTRSLSSPHSVSERERKTPACPREGSNRRGAKAYGGVAQYHGGWDRLGWDGTGSHGSSA
jgi:hypothetical protein